MERVQDDQVIEIYDNDIQFYLREFCELHNIPDMKKESQSVWNGALHYIYKNLFKGTDKLKSKHKFNNGSIQITTCGAYDLDKVMQVLDVYIYDLCLPYDKEVSQVGFHALTGITLETIESWGNGDSRVGSSAPEIYKKLRSMREESLSNKLVTGKQNPVGVLGVLNRHYQWNMPGVSREKATTVALDASLLPKLGNVRQIAQEENGSENE